MTFGNLASATDERPVGNNRGDGSSADLPSNWLPRAPDQWPLVVDDQQSAPRTLTSGVTHNTDVLKTVGGAQQASVMNVDLTNPNLRLGVVQAGDHLTTPQDEVLTSMAHRTGAVAGINGDFFEIYGSGRPLGMVTINGQLVKSPNPNWPATLGVRPDGSIAIQTQTYTGTVAIGSAAHPLTSVNTVNDLSGGGLVRITSYLGATPIPTSTVVTGHRDATDPTRLVVDGIAQGVTSLPMLPQATEDLAGGGESGQWLAANVHPGDRLALTEHISPDENLSQAVSGGAVLVQNGTMAVPLHGGGENNVNNPVTGVGVTKDGKHAIFAVFDGHAPENVAAGLTRPQLASWMMQHGAHNAILFDSGGSSEMVGRLPGQTQASVLNTPSDGHERPVANGLFIYSNERSPGAATTAVVNDGKPLTVLAGTTVPVSGYATDAAANPARDQVRMSVEPADLARIQDGTLVADSRSGHGRLVVQAGGARGSVPLTVTRSLSSLAISPNAPDLGNGGSQQFTVSGKTEEGTVVDLPARGLTWSVRPAALGTVDPSGLFTAALSGSGLATVTVSIGGATATATVAVGQVSQTIDPMTNVSQWGLRAHGGATASMSLSTTEKNLPTDAGSMDISYQIPAGQGVKQVVFWPNVDESFPPPGVNQQPTAVGLWIKGTGTDPAGSPPPLSRGNLTFAEGFTQINGRNVNFYPSTVTYQGWRLIVAQLPPGLQFPLSVNFLDFLVINPATTLSGHLYVSDLQALYSPRQPQPLPYVPVPQNPEWLQYTQNVADLESGGTNIVALDDAHMHANAPNSTGRVLMDTIGGQLRALPARLGPLSMQTGGDMSDTGQPADLSFMKSVLDSTKVPYRTAVGNHEISQGGHPENVNWTQLFGPTHYTYPTGAARVIVTDSSHGGLLASDPFQVPSAEDQYQWLVAQLSANTSKVAFVVTHMPAYDPHAIKNSQFADRWEAQMYEQLVTRYQQTHPDKHVILLYGHARGFAENLLDPMGNNVPGGLPNIVAADVGAEAYAPVDQGGFYNYVLFHVLPNGDVQFVVQAVLAKITIAAPATTLVSGAHVQLSATGTTPTGDDLTPLQVPIADPVSHVWSSSDPNVAAVDPTTGLVTTDHAGTATITCTAGTISSTVTLTVTEE